MATKRALHLLLRISRHRSAAQFTASAARRNLADNSAIPSRYTCYYDCSSLRHHWSLLLGIILSGQTVMVLGREGVSVFADDDSVAEVVTETNQGEALVTDLQRIEDGSVISNVHTSKWRVFTDNGRESFLKGKLDDAEKYFLAALHEAKEGFGPRDPHVASSCNNLAELYRVKKEYEKAEPLYLEAISILMEAFGADDIRLGAALHNLGQFYLAQWKFEQAQSFYERSLKIKGRVLGYGNPDYADTMYHLAKVLYLQGKVKEAQDLMRESIRILEEAGLGESIVCIRRMKYLAQRKVFHILELSKGWDSLETVLAAESLAITLESLGILTEAKELLERCLAARQKILPQDHIQIAANMLHLARIHLLNSSQTRKVDFSEAISELDKANTLLDTSIRISKANLNHPSKRLKYPKSNNAVPESDKELRVALVTLVQSLDALGLVEVTKQELIETGEEYEQTKVEHALHDCISIFREPNTQRLLVDDSNIKAEYLSCLKHLVNTICESKCRNRNSGAQELIDEAQQIESMLSPGKQ